MWSEICVALASGVFLLFSKICRTILLFGTLFSLDPLQASPSMRLFLFSLKIHGKLLLPLLKRSVGPTKEDFRLRVGLGAGRNQALVSTLSVRQHRPAMVVVPQRE